jgi:hypothetical protein
MLPRPALPVVPDVVMVIAAVVLITTPSRVVVAVRTILPAEFPAVKVVYGVEETADETLPSLLLRDHV